MINHIARLSVSVGLVVGSLVACASTPDGPAAEGAVHQTTQALRNCPDGPCEPVEPKDPKPPPTHPPPAPPAPTPDPPGPPDLHCDGGDLSIMPGTNPPQCWKLDHPGGRKPGGYVFATRYLCPALGTYPWCNAYGDCWCLH